MLGTGPRISAKGSRVHGSEQFEQALELGTVWHEKHGNTVATYSDPGNEQGLCP